jgi:hypothetical protein
MDHAKGCNFELIKTGFVVDTDPNGYGEDMYRMKLNVGGVCYEDGYEEGVTHNSWGLGGCAPLSEEYTKWKNENSGCGQDGDGEDPPNVVHRLHIRFNFCPVCGVKLVG